MKPEGLKKERRSCYAFGLNVWHVVGAKNVSIIVGLCQPLAMERCSTITSEELGCLTPVGSPEYTDEGVLLSAA